MTHVPRLSFPQSQRWQRILYRLRQFLLGLQAQVTAEEQQLVRTLLPSAAWSLFAQMPNDAQRHALNVLASVRQAGFVQADLAIAALLHDVGKCAADQAGIPLSLWLRGPLVILEALWPTGITRLRSPDPQHHWRYLLYVHQEHPRIGAAWAQQAGCSALACWLIAHHQEQRVNAPEPEYLLLLAALQKADNSF